MTSGLRKTVGTNPIGPDGVHRYVHLMKGQYAGDNVASGPTVHHLHYRDGRAWYHSPFIRDSETGEWRDVCGEIDHHEHRFSDYDPDPGHRHDEVS